MTIGSKHWSSTGKSMGIWIFKVNRLPYKQISLGLSFIVICVPLVFSKSINKIMNLVFKPKVMSFFIQIFTRNLVQWKFVICIVPMFSFIICFLLFSFIIVLENRKTWNRNVLHYTHTQPLLVIIYFCFDGTIVWICF